MDEESKQLVADRYIRRQKGEEVVPRYETRIIRKDGQIIHVDMSSSIVKDSKGNIFTVSFIRDITENKKLEEQLIQTEKLRALGEMASGVAHDFNNALAALLGLSAREDLIGRFPGEFFEAPGDWDTFLQQLEEQGNAHLDLAAMRRFDAATISSSTPSFLR